jgi:hypothetical protein
VEGHLHDCGLAAEFGTHYRMSALSGGQKVSLSIVLSHYLTVLLYHSILYGTHYRMSALSGGQKVSLSIPLLHYLIIFSTHYCMSALSGGQKVSLCIPLSHYLMLLLSYCYTLSHVRSLGRSEGESVPSYYYIIISLSDAVTVWSAHYITTACPHCRVVCLCVSVCVRWRCMCVYVCVWGAMTYT